MPVVVVFMADDLILADISFLLTFLRVRYFSQLEARKLLDNFMTRRTKFAKWFRNLDPADPKIMDIYDRGYVCVIQYAVLKL